MSPSNRPADAPPSAPFTALATVERSWRDALSYIAAGDVRSASAEIERADVALAQLGAFDRLRNTLPQSALTRFAAASDRLAALHRELTSATRSAQSALATELAGARNGKHALAAYGAKAPERPRSCDTLA